MVLSSVLGLIALVTQTLAFQTCTMLDHIEVKENKILLGSPTATFTLQGIMTCSRACLYRRRCRSFNFNTETGECQLNSEVEDSDAVKLEDKTNFVFSDISHWPEKLAGVCASHSCPLNSFCYPVNNSDYVCNATGCLNVPVIANGKLNKTQGAGEVQISTTLVYTCNPGFMSRSELVCQDDGTWSSPLCASVSSCSMVKQYQPDSEDGEYWLRLTNFDNYTTQIYCHNMTTSSPHEFLSLPNINYGIYPKVMNKHCTGETGLLEGCTGQGGEIWFSKIRFNISTMEVIREDKTFANVTGSDVQIYGEARDCYTTHPKSDLRCGTKGRFNIDLRGTGWRVNEDQQWETYGWFPVIESIDKQMNGTVINLRCGGFRGGCLPSGGLFLTPFL